MSLTVYQRHTQDERDLDLGRVALKDDIKTLLEREGAELDIVKLAHTLLSKYPNLASLKSRIKYPEEIAKVNISDLTVLIKDLDVENTKVDEKAKAVFQDLAHYYRDFEQRYRGASSDVQAVLLSPKAQIHGDLIAPYRIAQDVAYKLVSRSRFGDVIKHNETGNHPVVAINGLHLKSATEDEPLDTGMEICVYILHSLLFGNEIGTGLAPSSLLTLENVEIQEPTSMAGRDKDRYEEASVKNRRGSFCRRHPEFPLVSTPHKYFVQASRTIEGKALDEVLGSPDFDSLAWDEENFSALILASFLTIPSDNKPDNFIVSMSSGRPVAKITGIDNDMVFAYPLTVYGPRNEHMIGLKNALFFLDKMMDKPIAPKVRERIAKLDPILFGIEWGAAVMHQGQKYPFQKSDQVRLPLLFTKHTLQNLIENLQELQKILSDPSLKSVTHRELFRLLFPVVERYYQELAKERKAQSTADRIDNLFPTAAETGHPSCREKYILPSVEKYLRHDDKLVDGRTVKDVLRASNKETFSYTEERETPIEALCYDVLQKLDLSLLSPDRQCAMLTIAATHFPDLATKNLHPSRRSESLPFTLVQETGDLAVLPFLQNLGIPLGGQNPEGDTLVHLFVKHRKVPTKELMKVDNLETSNEKGLTPLDIAMDNQHVDAAIALINAGAGAAASSVRAWEFYQNVVKTKTDPHLTEAFQRLIGRNPRIAWKMAREMIFLPKGKGDRSVTSAFFGEKTLHPDAVKQLFNADGSIRAVNTTGKRAVGKATVDGFSLYFKQAPELPGVEQAVSTLMHQIMGFGAPLNDLVRINNIPYLVSQEIPGPSLQDLLESNPDQLKRLDKKRLSQLLLLTMLINPEDGKPDNYIVEPMPTGGFQIVSIDNDHAFVPSVAKEKLFERKQNRVQVKTILYCLDQMKDPIEASVREQFLMHNPADILMTWLGHLSNVHGLYHEVFSEEERQQLFEKHGIFVGIPFRSEMIAELYRKMVKMQFILDEQKNNPNFSHIDLLMKLDLPLGQRYSGSPAQKISPMQRFLAIDGKDYNIKGKNLVSTRQAREILHSYDITTKADVTSLIQRGTALDVEGALRKLQEIVSVDQNALVQQLMSSQGSKVDLASLSEEQMANILKKVDFSKLPIPVQQSILNQIKQFALKVLCLAHASLVTQAVLKGLDLSKTTSLDLTDCQGITDDAVGQIIGQAPELRKLNLSGNKSFKKILKVQEVSRKGNLVLSRNEKPAKPEFEEVPLNLNKITHLFLNHCPNLGVLMIDGDDLLELECANGDLTKVQVTSPDLNHVDFKNNNKLTDDTLVLMNCPSIRRWNFDGCSQLTQEKVAQPRYSKKFKGWRWGRMPKGCSPQEIEISPQLLSSQQPELHLLDLILANRPAYLITATIPVEIKAKCCYTPIDTKMVTLIAQAPILTQNVLTRLTLCCRRGGHQGKTIDRSDIESAKVLAQALRANTSLKYLDFSGTQMGSEGALAIADALKENRSLSHLRLACNQIGYQFSESTKEEHTKSLFSALLGNRTLLYLDLSGNLLMYYLVETIVNLLKSNDVMANFLINNNLSFSSSLESDEIFIKEMEKIGFEHDDGVYTRSIKQRNHPAPTVEQEMPRPITQIEFSTSKSEEVTPQATFARAKVMEKNDLHEAIEYYLDAANKGHQGALERLQVLSENHLPAQHALGCYYERTNDIRQAAFYFAAAAAGTHLQARQALYRLAEINSFAESQLAILLEKGMGMKQNIEQAIAMHEHAAKNGEGLSQLHLGILYYMGFSTEDNKGRAIALIDQAVQQGVPHAAKVKSQIVQENLERDQILKRAENCDQALYMLANKQPGVNFLNELPRLSKEDLTRGQTSIVQAQREALEREKGDILQKVTELERQVQTAGAHQIGFLRKQIEDLQNNLVEIQEKQKVQLDPVEAARQIYLIQKRQLFFSEFKDKFSNVLQAVNAILSGEASRSTSITDRAASAVVKGTAMAVNKGISIVAGAIPFVGIAVNIATTAIEEFIKYRKDEEVKRQCLKVQGYYPEAGMQGANKLSSLLAAGLAFRFKDHLIHLQGESLERLAKYFVLSFTAHLAEKAPEDASTFDLLVGGALCKPTALKELFLKKPLQTNYGMEWSIDDLLFSTGVRTIYGGKYLPKDPKRRAFISEVERMAKEHQQEYPIYRWGSKEEIEMLANLGIEMECIEEERVGALAVSVDNKKAAVRYLQEAESLASLFDTLYQ